jgi:hypothetical protein
MYVNVSGGPVSLLIYKLALGVLFFYLVCGVDEGKLRISTVLLKDHNFLDLLLTSCTLEALD